MFYFLKYLSLKDYETLCFFLSLICYYIKSFLLCFHCDWDHNIPTDFMLFFFFTSIRDKSCVYITILTSFCIFICLTGSIISSLILCLLQLEIYHVFILILLQAFIYLFLLEFKLIAFGLPCWVRAEIGDNFSMSWAVLLGERTKKWAHSF